MTAKLNLGDKDTKKSFGNYNDITGDTISSSFAGIAQSKWDNIFGEKPAKERYKKTEYDNNGNPIGEYNENSSISNSVSCSES